jgi:hypothetical protein
VEFVEQEASRAAQGATRARETEERLALMLKELEALRKG